MDSLFYAAHEPKVYGMTSAKPPAFPTHRCGRSVHKMAKKNVREFDIEFLSVATQSKFHRAAVFPKKHGLLPKNPESVILLLH